MFLQALDIKYSTIRYYVGKHKTGITPEKIILKKFNKSEDYKFLCNFFDSLPKLPSHYCRQSTTKMYLETTFSSMAQVFSFYKQECHNNAKNSM